MLIAPFLSESVWESPARPPAQGRRTKQFIQLLDWLRRQSRPSSLLAMLIRFAPCFWMARWRDWIMTQESALNCRPYSVNSVYRNTRRVRKLYQSLIFTERTPCRVCTLQTQKTCARRDSIIARRETEEINHTLCIWNAKQVNHKWT